MGSQLLERLLCSSHRSHGERIDSSLPDEEKTVRFERWTDVILIQASQRMRLLADYGDGDDCNDKTMMMVEE